MLVMAESFSVERRKLMRFLGAKLVLTPAPLGATGMVVKCQELAAANGWFMTRQFENDANPAYHAKTTAQEILKDFEGERLDYFVTGFGTVGAQGRRGRAQGEAAGDQDRGLRTRDRADARFAPAAGAQARRQRRIAASGRKPHPYQGWSPDFIPKIAGDARR